MAVAVAIASAFRDQFVLADTLVLGEVGLAGEIRSISQAVLRINEAANLGFKHCILPKNNYKGLDYPAVTGSREIRDTKDIIELVPVSNLKEALDILLLRGKR